MVRAGRLQSALEYTCLVIAALFSLSFIVAACVRLFYPFSLEWMEGNTVDIIQRIRDGLPLYVKPSLEFVPYIYTPLYFYVSALISYVVGVDFLAGRLVSMLSALGTAGILYAWIRCEQGSKVTACITAGLFLATYKLSGFWFDVARIDSFCLFLMVCGLYVFYFTQHPRNAVLAGILFACACFTKQSAVITLFPCFLVALIINRRQAFITGITTAGLLAIACAGFELSSGGWFSFYTYDVPAGHKNDMRQIGALWTRDFSKNCLVIIILAAGALFLIRNERKKLLWYSGMAFGFIGSACLMRIHSYGHVNVLMNAHVVLVLLTGLMMVHIPRRLYAAACVALLVQFSILYYNPMRIMPTEADEEKGKNFLAQLAKIEGDVFISELQYMQTRMGKQRYSIGMSGFDVLRANLGKKNYIKMEYAKDIMESIKQQKFAAIITGRFIRVKNLKGNYALKHKLEHPREFTRSAVYSPMMNVLYPVARPSR